MIFILAQLAKGHVSFGHHLMSMVCDIPWEKQIQICINEVDPCWGWAIRGPKKGGNL
jgi:hypothetical protein